MISRAKNPYMLHVEQTLAYLEIYLYEPNRGGNNPIWQSDVRIDPEQGEIMLVGVEQFHHGNDRDLLCIDVRSNMNEDIESKFWITVYDDGSVGTFMSTGVGPVKRKEVPTNVVAVDERNDNGWVWRCEQESTRSNAMSVLASLAPQNDKEDVNDNNTRVLYDSTNDAGIRMLAELGKVDKQLSVRLFRRNGDLLFEHCEDFSEWALYLRDIDFCLDMYDQDEEKELLWINWMYSGEGPMRCCSYYFYFWHVSGEVNIVASDGSMTAGETDAIEYYIETDELGKKYWRSR